MSGNTQALTVKRQEHQLVLTGNAIRDRVKSVIDGRFRHRNDDGSIFTPRISGSLVWPGVAQVIVIDPQRLWHFSIARMTNEDTLALLQIATGRPVQAIRKIPAGALGNREAREVLAYAVLLKDGIGTSGNGKHALPKMSARSNFDAGLIPSGDYMLPIGTLQDGKALWVSMLDLPHIKVTGETGSGKSTFIKIALSALTAREGADRLRIAIACPKRSEFGMFADFPHIWRSETWDGRIAGNADEAAQIITDLRNEFDRRDNEFMRVGVSNLDDYNRRVEASRRMPRILLVVDEFIDLVKLASRSSRMLDKLCSLVSIGRSHGIHLMLGTTKPHFEVLPTMIRDNIDNSVCFRVVDAEAARVAGCPGAELLPEHQPGRGIVRLGTRLEHFQALNFEAEGGSVRLDGAEQAGTRADLRLTVREAQLVRYAVNELGSWFVVDALAKAFDGNPSGHDLRQLAARWEACGLLEVGRKPNANGRGTTRSRRVTQQLIRLGLEEK